ncbi:hypothetical protein SAMN04489832_0318 [Micromonospora cremea]|uniref:Uncharacterized protein n=1 Tax=Micromonospora cremea TaxID=709881 RepID=A0A1N5TQP8_9ACTN|nr:hypothetical protein SAMN04489832_0318 [Micromonospora cremea]
MERHPVPDRRWLPPPGHAQRERHYPVKGQDTDPVAQALEVWLDARSRLEAAMEPIFQRISTPLDLVQLNDLRIEENVAWDRFRTVRLTDTTEGGQ